MKAKAMVQCQTWSEVDWAWAMGYVLYRVSEMDEVPEELESLDEIRSYTPDQVYYAV